MAQGRCWAHVALLLSLATLLAASDTYYPDKRTESRPFVLGSRYGRSGAPATLHLAPRNDRDCRDGCGRFFMGSRYGKRSGDGGGGGGEAAVAEAAAAAAEGGSGEGAGAGMETLACRYTGVYRLYHCAPARHHDIPQASLHSSERNDITDEIITDDMKEIE